MLDRHCGRMGKGSITVGEVNDQLDRLVAASKHEENANVLGKLLECVPQPEHGQSILSFPRNQSMDAAGSRLQTRCS